ncbi:MAG: CHAD domain-containing protein [Bacteroidales bacterium]|jgi:CHAD domain-containing protein
MELDYVKLKEVKPVISGYISEALFLMKRAPVPDDAAVHDIRVLMKKSRAVMKLLATHLDPGLFQKEYITFRDIGRALCSFRETSVHRKTLKGLKKMHRELFSRLTENEKIGTLLKKNDIHAEIPAGVRASLDITIDMLSRAAFRIRFLSLDNLDPRVLLQELEKSYKIVCQDYVDCRNTLKPAHLHQLRKRLKDFLYQLYFFRPLNPVIIKSLEKKIDGLSQDLGGYNDLTQLLEAIDYKISEQGKSPAMDELMIIIRNKQDVYLSKIWPVAYKIFCPGQQLLNVLGFKLLMI